MFYWISDEPAPKVFDPKDKRWVEIWNDVFMQYNKTADVKYIQLEQKNVDTGLGVERVAMVLQSKKTIFDTELFRPIFEKISDLTGTKPNDSNIRSYRIIADHMRASTFILGDERGVVPSNVGQGYVLRRYIRRIIRHSKFLGGANNFTSEIAKTIIRMYKDEYPILEEKKEIIISELQKEEERFEQTLMKGLKEFNKLAGQTKVLDGKTSFLLFQSYGFPLEMIKELADEKNIKVDEAGFQKEFNKHQELSRVGAEKMFKGGLSESSDITKKLHTATHLLNEALRKVVSKDISQKGSNITPERLRFDFNCDHKLSQEEIKKVEDLVNKKIKEAIPIIRKEMSLEEAQKLGAQAEFGAKYSEKVSVYFIGDFSIEVCGGPHVENTKELGHFKILKEESSAAGIRRIKAIVE
jgi:alanyl-tRNA synthetase